MIQSQRLLSSLGISYADCLSQADIDAKAQGVLAAYTALKTGIYTSPAPISRDPLKVYDYPSMQAHDAAVFAMYTAMRAGDVATMHADCDRANAVDCNAPVVSCPAPDIQVLANHPGWTGRVASMVLDGEIGALSDLDKASAIISAALAETSTPPQPAPVTPMFFDLPGPLPGYAVGQTVNAPDGTKYAYCALPFGWPSGVTYRLVRLP